MGYNIFAGLVGFNWSNSGNQTKDHSPRNAGCSQDAIVGDMNQSNTPRWYSPHSKPSGADWGMYPDKESELNWLEPPFWIDTNTGYGDGHVEKHTELDLYIHSGTPFRCYF